MNKFWKVLGLVVILGCQHTPLKAQRSTEKIKKTLTSAKVLLVANINGFVNVEGGSGNSIEITATKLITGDSKKEVSQGAKETSLAMFNRNDSAIVHVKNPYIDYRPRKKGRGFGYNWDNNNNETGYNFKFDITVKVPRNTQLIIRTINNGDINIKNTTAEVITNNINGSIFLENIAGKTKARTINGQLKANYSKVPDKNSTYYALNGNIRISYPKKLSAELRFKSFNGEFYTDYDVEYLPTKVTTKHVKRGKKKVYKVNEYTAVKVNKGGKVFKFETLNGNIYINKQK